jgi:nucleotide-binding universal stress UspA family protein
MPVQSTTAMLGWSTSFHLGGIVFKRIVLGLDGSDESTKALEYARKLAASEDAHVEIVHVHEYMIAGRAGMQPVRADEDELEATVRRQAEDLKSSGVDAHLTIVSTSAGGPAHVLADHARTDGADVIVVGTRGRTTLAGLLLGSVTQRLMHVSPCPVLAIPSGVSSDTSTEAATSAAVS